MRPVAQRIKLLWPSLALAALAMACAAALRKVGEPWSMVMVAILPWALPAWVADLVLSRRTASHVGWRRYPHLASRGLLPYLDGKGRVRLEGLMGRAEALLACLESLEPVMRTYYHRAETEVLAAVRRALGAEARRLDRTVGTCLDLPSLASRLACSQAHEPDPATREELVRASMEAQRALAEQEALMASGRRLDAAVDRLSAELERMRHEIIRLGIQADIPHMPGPLMGLEGHIRSLEEALGLTMPHQQKLDA